MVHLEQTAVIAQRLTSARGVLVINPHRPRADGDSIGSSLGLARSLTSAGTPAWVFSREVPASLKFLPGAESIITDPAALPLSAIDVAVTVDFSELAMSGIADVLTAGPRPPTIIKIDHHLGGTAFGTCNLVDPTAASTTELVYHLLARHRLPLDQDVATCLLTGIITDTASFLNLNTTAVTLSVAGRLLAAGARARAIGQAGGGKTIASLKLWGVALERLHRNDRFHTVTTVITRDDVDPDNGEATEGIATFLNSLGEGRLCLVLRQEGPDTVRGSLRTTRPDVDVSALARTLGGGGHTKAAGFTVQGRLVRSGAGWRVV